MLGDFGACLRAIRANWAYFGSLGLEGSPLEGAPIDRMIDHLQIHHCKIFAAGNMPNTWTFVRTLELRQNLMPCFSNLSILTLPQSLDSCVHPHFGPTILHSDGSLYLVAP